MVSKKECLRRYKALRQAMRIEGYHALLLSGNAEATQRGYVRYVSDWRLWGGDGYVLLSLEHDAVLILGPGSQAHWAAEVGWIQDVRSVMDKVDEAAESLKRMGLSRAKIGVVGLERVMSFGDAKALVKALPDAEISDATALVDGVMALKSQEELERIGETYDLVAQAMRLVKEALAPGKTEREVMAKAVGFLASKGCLDGIAHLSHAMPPFIRPPCERSIQVDDVIKVSLEFAGPAGYWIELAGIFSFQEPADWQRRHFATTAKAVQRAAELMRPGNTGGDLSQAILETFREDGWEVTGRVIWDVHGIGLNVITPPIGLPGSEDEIKEHMTLNIHPGLLVGEKGWGVYIQDNMQVTPQGGRPLGDYEYVWHVLSA